MASGLRSRSYFGGVGSENFAGYPAACCGELHWFVWLNQTNQMNKTNQINPSRLSRALHEHLPFLYASL